MKKYTNSNPIFTDTIDIYEETDPVDADSVDNVPLKQLQDNVLSIKNDINGLSIATMQEVIDVAEELMDDYPEPTPVPPEDIATDEDIEDLIDDLHDL